MEEEWRRLLLTLMMYRQVPCGLLKAAVCDRGPNSSGHSLAKGGSVSVVAAIARVPLTFLPRALHSFSRPHPVPAPRSFHSLSLTSPSSPRFHHSPPYPSYPRPPTNTPLSAPSPGPPDNEVPPPPPPPPARHPPLPHHLLQLPAPYLCRPCYHLPDHTYDIGSVPHKREEGEEAQEPREHGKWAKSLVSVVR